MSSRVAFNITADEARIEALNGQGLTQSDLEFVLQYLGLLEPESKTDRKFELLHSRPISQGGKNTHYAGK